MSAKNNVRAVVREEAQAPSDVLYETTAIARAGATNTKSGTWVRSAFERALPRRGAARLHTRSRLGRNCAEISGRAGPWLLCWATQHGAAPGYGNERSSAWRYIKSRLDAAGCRMRVCWNIFCWEMLWALIDYYRLGRVLPEQRTIRPKFFPYKLNGGQEPHASLFALSARG